MNKKGVDDLKGDVNRFFLAYFVPDFRLLMTLLFQIEGGDLGE